MAARKSCTHLKWSDAKSSSTPGGGGGSSSNNNPNTTKSAKGPPKKLTHQQILAQRIKQGGKFVEASKPWTKQQIDRHMSAVERAQRQVELDADAEQQSAERLEAVRLSRIVKPTERARETMASLARRWQEKHDPTTIIITQRQPRQNCNSENDTEIEEDDENETASTPHQLDMETLQNICECRRMQLDEMDALEAIYTDTDEFLVAHASELDQLRYILERLDDNEGDTEHSNMDLMQALADHSLLSCTLQLTIPDHRCSDVTPHNNTTDTPTTHSAALVASILLQVTLPLLYPAHGSAPIYDFKYTMVTDANEECAIDKAPVTLAHLDELTLREQMLLHTMDVLSDPCIYEIAATFLSENVFHYMTVPTHALLTTKR